MIYDSEEQKQFVLKAVTSSPVPPGTTLGNIGRLADYVGVQLALLLAGEISQADAATPAPDFPATVTAGPDAQASVA